MFRNKTIISTLLNILGMSAAFAALYILGVQVNYDLGYNKFVKDSDRLYAVAVPSWFYQDKYQLTLNRPLTNHVLEQAPMVEEFGVATLLGTPNTQIIASESGDGPVFNVNFSHFTLSAVKMFGFEAIEGSFDGMDNEMKVAIRESTAKLMGVSAGDRIRFKGMESPVGVAAIFKDMPMNSDFDMDVVYCHTYDNSATNDWSNWAFYHFVRLHSSEDKAAFEELAAELTHKYVSETFSQMGDVTEENINDYVKRATITLIPFDDLYFSKNLQNPAGRSGNKTTTLTLLAVAIIILIITLINFVNFFLAQVPMRIRAVNTRKILGSSRASLIGRFMLETGILTVISLLLALAIVLLFKSSTYSDLISSSLDFEKNIPVLIITVASALFMTIAASLYPSLYITSIPPAMAISGSFGVSGSGEVLRNALVGLQFVISISFVICAMFVKLQHGFLMNYDMGFDKEQLMTVAWVPLQDGQREAFDSELLKNPQIEDCAWAATNLVQHTRMGWGREFNGHNINFDSYPVLSNFLKFMGIDVVEGRDFSKSDEMCENGIFIFNQKAKEQFGLTLENKIQGHVDTPADIAGFCEDFKFKPLQYDVTPFAFYVFGNNGWWEPSHLYFRTTADADISEVITYVKETILKFAPDYSSDDFVVEFFEEELGFQYEKEKQLTKMVTIFTLLAIIISLIGVFGLVMFETEYKRKEIGVRRVNGATVQEILLMFNKKFVGIVLICFVIAAPISWIIMNRYLSGFAYRIDLYLWVFIAALLAVLLITMVTVTLRSYYASTQNPVDALRNE